MYESFKNISKIMQVKKKKNGTNFLKLKKSTVKKKVMKVDRIQVNLKKDPFQV